MVGGITPEKIPGYLAAGATGFGTGGQLFQPGVRNCRAAETGGALRGGVAAKFLVRPEPFNPLPQRRAFD